MAKHATLAPVTIAEPGASSTGAATPATPDRSDSNHRTQGLNRPDGHSSPAPSKPTTTNPSAGSPGLATVAVGSASRPSNSASPTTSCETPLNALISRSQWPPESTEAGLLLWVPMTLTPETWEYLSTIAAGRMCPIETILSDAVQFAKDNLML